MITAEKATGNPTRYNYYSTGRETRNTTRTSPEKALRKTSTASTHAREREERGHRLPEGSSVARLEYSDYWRVHIKSLVYYSVNFTVSYQVQVEPFSSKTSFSRMFRRRTFS
jgi:hypothetical protein